LKGRGFSGRELLTIRANGYNNGNMISSQPLAVRIEGEKDDEGGLPASTYLYAGGGATTVGAFLIGSFGYLYSASEVFRYKWLLFAFIPLYSTVHREKVLDHFFRGRLFEFIKENPGITFTALKDHFEVTNGTLTYHLHRLEKEELIVHRNLGKYKLFYADGVRIKGVEAVISPIDRDIISLITDHPGISSNAIISNLSTNRSQRTISRHLKQLERNGFITSERRNGKRVFFIAGDVERVLMPKRGVVSVAEMTGADH
jgi:DNA-binding MarR family transcriptional regulator